MITIDDETMAALEKRRQEDIDQLRSDWVAMCKTFESLSHNLILVGVRLNEMIFMEENDGSVRLHSDENDKVRPPETKSTLSGVRKDTGNPTPEEQVH